MNSPTTAVRLQSSARQRGGEFRNTRGRFFRDLDHDFVTAVKLDHFALGIVGGERSLHVWAEQLVGLSRQNDERRRPRRAFEPALEGCQKQGPQPFDGIEMGTVGRKEDLDGAHRGMRALDLAQELDEARRADLLDGEDLRLAGFQIDGAWMLSR